MHEAREKMHKSPAPSIRFYGGGAHTAGKGKDFPPHKHSLWELVYYRSGHIRCPVGHAEYPGVPGLLLLTPPDTVHSEIALTAYSNYFVSLSVDGDPGWPIAIYDDPALGLQALFAAIVRELTGVRPFGDELLGVLAAQLNLILRRACMRTTAAPAEAAVIRAEALIEERYSASLHVTDLADEIGCSASALRSYFAAYRKLTPHSYLQAVRLRHAMAFIKNSSLPLQAVAEQCGFDSASHLSRCVKQATNLSPGRLRREVGNGV